MVINLLGGIVMASIGNLPKVITLEILVILEVICEGVNLTIDHK
jgi:hypothetical protein